jgi:hypothetical protein
MSNETGITKEMWYEVANRPIGPTVERDTETVRAVVAERVKEIESELAAGEGNEPR